MKITFVACILLLLFAWGFIAESRKLRYEWNKSVEEARSVDPCDENGGFKLILVKSPPSNIVELNNKNPRTLVMRREIKINDLDKLTVKSLNTGGRIATIVWFEKKIVGFCSTP